MSNRDLRPEIVQTGILRQHHDAFTVLFKSPVMNPDASAFPGTSEAPLIGRLADPASRAGRIAITTSVYEKQGYISPDPNHTNALPVVTTQMKFTDVLSRYAKTPLELAALLMTEGASTTAIDSFMNHDGLILESTQDNRRYYLDKLMYSTTAEYGLRIDGQIMGSARIISQADSPTLRDPKIWNNIKDPAKRALALSAGGEISQFAHVSVADRRGIALPLLLRAIFNDAEANGIENLSMNIDGGLQAYLNGLFKTLSATGGVVQLAEPVYHLGSETTTWVLNIPKTRATLAGSLDVVRKMLVEHATENAAILADDTIDPHLTHEAKKRQRHLSHQLLICLALGNFPDGVPSLKSLINNPNND